MEDTATFQCAYCGEENLTFVDSSSGYKQVYWHFRSEAAAVRWERERQEDKRERLLEALRVGDADIAAGRVIPYIFDLLSKIEQAARQHAASAPA